MGYNQICQICSKTLNEVTDDHLQELRKGNNLNCLRTHIDKFKSEKEGWSKIASFFSNVQLWITQESDLAEIKNIASGLPKSFFINCLLPYIHEGMECKTNTDNKDLGDKNVFEVITQLTSKLIDGCEENESEAKDLIDDVKRVIEHYSTHPKGGQLLNSIIEGFCKSRGNLPRNKWRYSTSFLCIAALRQAFWENLQPMPRNTNKTDRTIRINGLPFAESAYIYYLSECASDFDVNLEIIDVPWNEVGLSLLTGRIDIAIHNKSLWENQLPIYKKLAQNRMLYRSESIFQYHFYCRLCHKDKGRIKKNCIAIVKDSDHCSVFKEWTKVEKNLTSFLSSINYPNPDAAKPGCDYILPVSSADAAVAAFLDEGIAECLVGGIHKHYIKSEFNSEIDTIILTGLPSTEIYFTTLANSAKLAENNLADVISSWKKVVNDWDWIKNGLPEETQALQIRILAHVNRQPYKAFISDFNQLHDLLSQDNKLESPSSLSHFLVDMDKH